MKLQVDSKMLPMKAHYFFYNAGMSTKYTNLYKMYIVNR